MSADLNVLLHEVNEVIKLLQQHNKEIVIDGNAIFASLKQNFHRNNHVEYVVRQFLGHEHLDEIDQSHDITGNVNVDLTQDPDCVAKGDSLSNHAVGKKNVSNRSFSISLDDDEDDDDVIVLDLDSCSSDVEILTESTSSLGTRSRSDYKRNVQNVGNKSQSHSPMDAEIINSPSVRKAPTIDLDDANINDPNNFIQKPSVVAPLIVLDDVNDNDPNNFIQKPSAEQSYNSEFNSKSSLASNACCDSIAKSSYNVEFHTWPSISRTFSKERAPKLNSKPFETSNACYTTQKDKHNIVDGDFDEFSSEECDVLPLNQNQEGIRDALLAEARLIHNIVPNQHLDQIFSYLEANLDNVDRMNVVLSEFLKRNEQNERNDQKEQNVYSLPSTSAVPVKTCEASVVQTSVPITSTVDKLKSSRKIDANPAFWDTNVSAVPEAGICSISDNKQPILPPSNEAKENEDTKAENATPAGNEFLALSVHNLTSTVDRQENSKRKSEFTDRHLLNKKVSKTKHNQLNQEHLATRKPNKKEVKNHYKGLKIEDSSKESQEKYSRPVDLKAEDGKIKELPEKHSIPGGNGSVLNVQPFRNLEMKAGPVPVKVEDFSEQNAHSSSSMVTSSKPCCSKSIDSESDCKEAEEEVRYQTLLAIFPAADPEFLWQAAKHFVDNGEGFRNFITHILETKNFPTREEYEQRLEKAALQKKYFQDFSVEAFLDMFPDPIKYFKESEKVYNLKDRTCAIEYLKNKFHIIMPQTVIDIYQMNKYNLTKAFEELLMMEKELMEKRGNTTFHKTWHPKSEYQVPDEPNKMLLQEIAFLEHKDDIETYLKKKAEKRQKAFEDEKAKGKLVQCGCCYDNEVMTEDVSVCEEGHIFCKDCIKRSAEILIGEGKISFPCLTNCNAEFNLKTLQDILSSDIFSKLLKRKQIEEVKQAGIEGLETCPFCDFASIPDEGNKIFQCLNPECMKESCRTCREPSHIPLRCEEVEKSDEVKMRKYIEDRMTKALVRECWKCKRKFVKKDGCNKMRCLCGALMCYICRQPVKDYKHFNGQGGTDYSKCPLFSDDKDLHETAVKKEALKAKREVAEQNPNLKLKNDPTKYLPKVKNSPHLRPAAFVLPMRQYANENAYRLLGIEVERLLVARRFMQQQTHLVPQRPALEVQRNPAQCFPNQIHPQRLPVRWQQNAVHPVIRSAAPLQQNVTYQEMRTAFPVQLNAIYQGVRPGVPKQQVASCPTHKVQSKPVAHEGINVKDHLCIYARVHKEQHAQPQLEYSQEPHLQANRFEQQSIYPLTVQTADKVLATQETQFLSNGFNPVNLLEIPLNELEWNNCNNHLPNPTAVRITEQPHSQVHRDKLYKPNPAGQVRPEQTQAQVQREMLFTQGPLTQTVPEIPHAQVQSNRLNEPGPSGQVRSKKPYVYSLSIGFNEQVPSGQVRAEQPYVKSLSNRFNEPVPSEQVKPKPPHVIRLCEPGPSGQVRLEQPYVKSLSNRFNEPVPSEQVRPKPPHVIRLCEPGPSGQVRLEQPYVKSLSNKFNEPVPSEQVRPKPPDVIRLCEPGPSGQVRLEQLRVQSLSNRFNEPVLSEQPHLITLCKPGPSGQVRFEQLRVQSLSNRINEPVLSRQVRLEQPHVIWLTEPDPLEVDTLEQLDPLGLATFQQPDPLELVTHEQSRVQFPSNRLSHLCPSNQVRSEQLNIQAQSNRLNEPGPSEVRPEQPQVQSLSNRFNKLGPSGQARPE